MQWRGGGSRLRHHLESHYHDERNRQGKCVIAHTANARILYLLLELMAQVVVFKLEAQLLVNSENE